MRYEEKTQLLKQIHDAFNCTYFGHKKDLLKLSIKPYLIIIDIVKDNSYDELRLLRYKTNDNNAYYKEARLNVAQCNRKTVESLINNSVADY